MSRLSLTSVTKEQPQSYSKTTSLFGGSITLTIKTKTMFIKKLLLSAAIILGVVAAGFAQESTKETFGNFSVTLYSDGTTAMSTEPETSLDGSVSGVYFTAYVKEDGTILFSLYDSKATKDYSGYKFTVASILNGDKSTILTKSDLPGFGTGFIDITSLITIYEPAQFIASEYIHVKVGRVVFKFSLDGFGDAVAAADENQKKEADNPFAGTDDNPFGTTANIQTSQDWVEWYMIESLNPFDVRGYIEIFLNDATDAGIDVSHVRKGDIEVEFKSVREDGHMSANTIAYTDSLGDDDRVHIVVNPAAWKAASPAKRLAIIYHELGHDILNFEHNSEEGPLMSIYARSDYSFEDLYELKTQMFNDYKNGVEYSIKD